MLADDIKSIVFDSENVKKGKLSQSEFARRKKKAVSSLRQKRASASSPEEAWLIDNRDLLIQTLNSISIKDFLLSRFTENVIKRVLSKEQWEGTREEFQCFAESIVAKHGFFDGETESLINAFIFLLTEKIIQDKPTSYPYDFTLFHHLRTIPSGTIVKGFSPLDQILRFDPDGTYSKMDINTQQIYQNRIRRMARKAGKTPEIIADACLKKAKADNRHIGFYILRNKKNHLYYPLIILLFLTLSFAFLTSGKNVVFYSFTALPLLYFSRNIVRLFFGVIVKSETLCSMKPDVITSNRKTAVVIPCLVGSPEDVKNIIKRLHRFAVNNREANDQISFGLICDLKESKTPFTVADTDIIHTLKEEIQSLNEKEPCYFALIRERSYLSCENAYCGKERKRGAIIEFCSFCEDGALQPGSELFGEVCSLKGTRYLITLDSDTELSIDQARRLVAYASHPLNRPVVKDKNGQKRVVQGYGILQPRMNTSLLNPIRTRYGKLISNGSGKIAYAGASFDTMQTLFGEGNFCGKGIIDVQAFCKVIPGVFPDERILSHDMPEGALLRCGLLSNEFFTDSDPQDAKSEMERLHRWIRGDTQNLFYLGKLPPLRRLFALESFGENLIPAFETGMLLYGAFSSPAVGLASVLLVLLFYGQNVISTTASILLSGNIEHFGRRFSTLIRNLVLNEIYRFLFSLVGLIANTWYRLDANLRSLWRMLFTHKHLLEWKTYRSSSEGSGKIAFYIAPFISSAVLSVITIRSLPALIFILTMFYPVLCEFMALPYRHKSDWSYKDKKYLLGIAQREFLFFKKSVQSNTNHLPPDNIQIRPVEKAAMRTSPTNIGLYLVSLIAATDLDLISTGELKYRLNNTLSVVEKLEKSSGNLYNWYDLETLSVIGNGYISTVDSGNFLASLVVLSVALRELSSKDSSYITLYERVEKMIGETDLSVLYDPERALFRVGKIEDNTDSGPHYDLLMSEARLTSFLAISLGQVKSNHWKSLSRPLLSFKGRAGAASWSGTAFEYFMPSLFYPTVANSLEDESLDFALFVQKQHGVLLNHKSRIFGISESGYPDTDQFGNYQYRAFGVPALSIKNEKNIGVVISPYASFLMLERKDKDVLINLDHLAESGMMGSLGFFEACSFDWNNKLGKKIVYSYMAHHKGMTMMALDNALSDNIMQKRFMSYPGLAEKMELLAERFPLERKSINRIKQKKKSKKRHSKPITSIFDLKPVAENAFLLSDGETSAIIDDAGHFSIMTSGIFWIKRFHLSFVFGNQIYTETDPALKSKLIVGKNCVEKTLDGNGFHAQIRIEILAEENAMFLCVQRFGKAEGGQLILSFDPILCEKREYDNHPAFSKLSLEYNRDRFGITITRRTMGEPVCLHLSTPFSFQIKNQSAALSEKSCQMMIHEPIELSLSFEESKSHRIPIVFRLDNRPDPKPYSQYFDGSFATKNALQERAIAIANRFDSICGYGQKEVALERKLLPVILGNGKMFLSESKEPLSRDFPWRLSLSGDLPVVSVFIQSDEDIGIAESYIKVAKKCCLCHVSFDLVLCVLEKEAYETPLRDAIQSKIEAVSASFLTNYSPGIHVISSIDNTFIRDLYQISIITSTFPETEIKCVPEVKIKSATLEGKGFGKFSSVVGQIGKGTFRIDRKSFDPDEPFSHVCSNRRCGFVCDQNSLGYTWCRNAALGRVSAWGKGEAEEEKLYLLYGNEKMDLLRASRYVSYLPGKAIWEGQFRGLTYRITASLSEMVNGKIIQIYFSDALPETAAIMFSFTPDLGRKAWDNLLVEEKPDHVIVKPTVAREVNRNALFFSDTGIVGTVREGNALMVSAKAENEITLYFGGFVSPAEKELILKTMRGNFLPVLHEEERFICDLLPSCSDVREQWFAYQTVFSRFYGRCARFQCGGGYGFRDQLQDVLIFLDNRPDLVRQHILRCASHQFTEGNVQHWWHPGVNTGAGGDPGVSTACSDDYLWLLYTAGRYLSETKDTEILDVKAPFILSAKEKKKGDHYFVPELSNTAPLKDHLVRCVELLTERGVGIHGLARMGSGDWNDGMNEVGGESVWLSEFALIVLHRILQYLDEEVKKQIKPFMETLLNGIKNSFNGSWFARAYREDGTVLGSDLSLEGECSIDLLPQAFAALLYCEAGASNAPDAINVQKALKNAFDILVKEKDQVVLLFTRPFTATEPSPGYIQRYTAGVRENGGQYTHAAVWYMIALLRFGRMTEDEELIRMAEKVERIINPTRYLDAKAWENYRREPYVLCGDVYDAPGAKGRGGWSWYTGAAGWYWQYLKEKRNKLP